MSDIHIYVDREQTVQAITIAPTGARGAPGTNGTNGANGGSTNAWDYNAKTNATSGYPGNGYLLWNNATQTSATSIIVSHLTDDDTDIELFLSFFVINQKIFIQNRDDSSQNQVWRITGTPTVTGANTSTAYYTFPVTLVSSAGAAFNNNHSLLFGQIVVATNAVTSATTSDGTADLDVDSIIARTTILAQSVNLTSFVNSPQHVVSEPTGEFGSSIKATNITTDRIIEVPDASGTMVLGGGTASGTNTGDQTTIVGITGTTAQFNTALTDGDFATLAGSETLTNKTLTSPTINSATIGTAATFNATTYTFGAGAAAAMNQKLGTNSVDSRISSLFSAPYNFVQDNFVGKAIVTSGNYSQLNWGIVGSASLSSDLGYYVAGYPGGTSISTNNNAFFLYLFGTSAANIALINDTVFDLVFNTSTNTNTVQNFFVGLRSWISATAETGRRGLSFEAGVDTNWQLLHETSAGVQTKIDTGKPALSNQTVRVTIKFVSATQTDMIIATSTSTTPVTVSATSGFSFTGFCGIGMWLKSTTAVSRILIPLRATLAWLSPTL